MNRTRRLGVLIAGLLSAQALHAQMTAAAPRQLEPRIDTGIEGAGSEASPPDLRSLQPGEQPPVPGAGATRRPTAEPSPESTTPETSKGRAYVGVLVESVDPSLRAHLKEPLGEDQGILVRHVEPGTPGERAGLQEFDILLKFGDRPLGSPRDLVAAVGEASPGDRVELEILRAGKLEHRTLTLGVLDEMQEFSLPGTRRRHPPVSPPEEPSEEEQPRDESTMPSSPSVPSLRPGVPRESSPPSPGFEALSMRNVEGGGMQIEYTFQGEAGDTERYTFRGSHDEIRKQIEDNRWLSEERKSSLLKALDTAGRATRQMFGAPGRQFMPHQGLIPHLERLLEQHGGQDPQTY